MSAGCGSTSLAGAPGATSAATSGQAASCAAAPAGAGVIVDAIALPGRVDPQGVLLSPARFTVLRYVKGRGPRTIAVQTTVAATPTGAYAYSEDGIAPRPEERWRLYGRRTRKGTLTTSTCSGSRRLTVSAPPRGRCPRPRPQRLPPDALAGAVLAALRQGRGVYGGVSGIGATRAVLADDDPVRGSYAGHNCGALVRHRTVVVYLRLPSRTPSASLSEGVVLVSRFSGRYRVWARLH